DTGRADRTFPPAVLVIDEVDPVTGQPGRPEFGPDRCTRRSGVGADALFGVELMKATVDEGDVAAITSFIVDQVVGAGPTAFVPAIRASAPVQPPEGVPVLERP